MTLSLDCAVQESDVQAWPCAREDSVWTQELPESRIPKGFYADTLAACPLPDTSGPVDSPVALSLRGGFKVLIFISAKRRRRSCWGQMSTFHGGLHLCRVCWPGCELEHGRSAEALSLSSLGISGAACSTPSRLPLPGAERT